MRIFFFLTFQASWSLFSSHQASGGGEDTDEWGFFCLTYKVIILRILLSRQMCFTFATVDATTARCFVFILLQKSMSLFLFIADIWLSSSICWEYALVISFPLFCLLQTWPMHET